MLTKSKKRVEASAIEGEPAEQLSVNGVVALDDPDTRRALDRLLRRGRATLLIGLFFSALTLLLAAETVRRSGSYSNADEAWPHIQGWLSAALVAAVVSLFTLPVGILTLLRAKRWASVLGSQPWKDATYRYLNLSVFLLPNPLVWLGGDALPYSLVNNPVESVRPFFDHPNGHIKVIEFDDRAIVKLSDVTALFAGRRKGAIAIPRGARRATAISPAD